MPRIENLAFGFAFQAWHTFQQNWKHWFIFHFSGERFRSMSCFVIDFQVFLGQRRRSWVGDEDSEHICGPAKRIIMKVGIIDGRACEHQVFISIYGDLRFTFWFCSCKTPKISFQVGEQLLVENQMLHFTTSLQGDQCYSEMFAFIVASGPIIWCHNGYFMYVHIWIMRVLLYDHVLFCVPCSFQWQVLLVAVYSSYDIGVILLCCLLMCRWYCRWQLCLPPLLLPLPPAKPVLLWR